MCTLDAGGAGDETERSGRTGVMSVTGAGAGAGGDETARSGKSGRSGGSRSSNRTGSRR